MNLFQATAICFTKYADFSGRARRSEYWYFYLFSLIGSFVLGIIENTIVETTGNGVPLMSGLFSLALILPTLSAGARRLHDTGRSGWWLLLWFLPLIGWIIVIVWLATSGEKGPNAHGGDPLDARAWASGDDDDDDQTGGRKTHVPTVKR